MKFTNDITFNKLPRANDILKITYSGNLFKNNSSDVYIVYGFGENWDYTTEQKMDKTTYGFVSNINIKDANTFNFCFKNSDEIWDNNNNFNYISSIFSKPLNTEVQSLDNQEADKVCSNSLDDILNSIDLELETSKSQNIEISEDLNVLDTLIQELFEEYNAKVENTSEIVSSSEPASLQNNVQEIISDTVSKENIEIEETSNVEYFSELSNLFNEIIQNIETNNSSETIDLGAELNKTFEKTFTENFSSSQKTSESYVPEADTTNEFSESEELNNTFSDIVKNISEVETKTNTEVKNLNYDYSDFNAMFSFAQNLNNSEKEELENIFDFSNKEFDFDMNNVVEDIVEETIFNFSNPEFDFDLNSIQILENEATNSNILTQNTYTNKFSDSFYDDEDVSTHENYSTIEETISTTAAENEAFEKVVNEYAEYFDNLIEEIVSTPTSTLSTSVSTAQVLENENTTLAVTENNSQEITNSIAENSTEVNGVPDKYALYDYSSHSFFYMFRRRVKMIFSAIFTKLPKIFSRQKDNENN